MRHCLPYPRELTGVLAATVLLLGVPAVLAATSARAAVTGPGVQPGHNITVSPDIDFVGVYGFRTGAVVAVEVIRPNPATGGEDTIGRVVAPAVSTRSGGGLELNHGPTGSANTPGACWDAQTPDIRPGDRILVTADGRTDEVTVDDIRFTSHPAEDPATGDVVLDGIARRVDGTPIPASTLDAGQFRNTTGEYRIFPDLVESTGPAGEFRVHYRAPYLGFRNKQNLSEEQRKAALLTENQHMIGYGDIAPLPAESQLINGIADASGAAIGCEAAPGGTTPLAPHDATPPTVTTRTPTDGATDVPQASAVTATFSKDISSVDDRSFSLRSSSGLAVPATVAYDRATRTATLRPGTPLKGGTEYTASLTDGVVDGSGNPLSPINWSFTTAAPSDTVPPALAATSPAADATDVALGTPVTATFSEDVIGVDSSSFALFGPDGLPSTEVTYDAATRTATLVATPPLAAGGTYIASLTSAIMDTAGNELPMTSWTFTTAAASDTVAPTVVDRSPVAQATGVLRTGTVTATFSEDVTGVENGFSLTGPGGTAVAASVAYDPFTLVATLTPNAQLTAGTTYTAAVSTAVTDPAGNPLTPTTWSFTTATPAPPADTVSPTVTARTPAAQARGVAVGTKVTATFSEPVTNVDGASLTLTGPGGVAVQATVGYDATTRVASLTPAAAMTAGSSYTAALTNAIADTTGNRLATTTWSFTTAGTAPRDTAAPVVVARGPGDGATGVALGTLVTATFNEPVSGVSTKTFTLTGPTGGVRATVTYNASTRIALLTPGAALPAGTRYTASLTNAVTDAAGNRLTATTWSFTTAGTATADTAAPTVTARAPAADATGVRRQDNVTVTFSEPVTGAGGTTVTLRTSSGAKVSATVRYNATSRVVTLNPASTLKANQRYQVILTNGIKDAAGNRLAGTSWTFTTGGA